MYQYTLDAPRSHHCGFLAQTVQKMVELTYTAAGGDFDEEGKGIIRY